MADRYWILGTGNWDATNTVNWSDTSGGSGGFSVPTASDNVYFDANSNVLATAFTVTMANTPRVCNDFTASGLDGVMTLAGTSIGLTVSGSLTFQATNFTRTYTGTTTFNATTTGKTVTTNGVAFGGAVTFNGVGGAWVLGSALATNSASNLTITAGTFDTSASNYAITCGNFVSTGSVTRSISLNASTVTLNLSTWNLAATNLTFNSGTSNIVLAYSLITFTGGGFTYYNVSTTFGDVVLLGIDGANTFNNLSISSRTVLGLTPITFAADQIINGTFTIGAGTTAAYRTQIASSFIGTPRTLTVNAISSLTDIDFRDIVADGASGTWSGTRLGDCKGNSNITFPAAKTVYYRQTGSANWSTSGSGSWSATSGGAFDATMFPLAQDTAVFPAATYPASGSTVTLNSSLQYPNNIGTIDMSLRTSDTMTLATSTYLPFIYGNWINGTGITISGTGTITFAGRTTQQITNAGISFTQPITINSKSGSVTLQDALTTAPARTTILANGTLDLQSYTLSTGLFNSSGNTGIRTIAFGTGKIFCTGTGTVWSTATNTGLTVTGTGTISLTNASAKTFAGGSFSYSGVTLNQGGAGALTITGSNTFGNITNTVQPASILFTAGTTSTFSSFSLSGTAGNLITIGSVTAASHTLSKASGTVSSDYLSISRSTATGGAGWYAGANSTDGGNNSGWTFAAAPVATIGYPYGSGHYGIGPYNIGNLIIPGNQATGAVGSVLADISVQEDGTIATGNVGTVTLTITIAITGNAATGAVGTLAPDSSKAVTGNAATLAVGTVAPARSIDVTGNAATGAVDSVGVTRSTATTGNAATGAVGTMSAEVISFQAITGVSGTGAVGSVSNVITVAIIGNEAVGSVGVMVGFGWGSIPDTSETWTAQSDTPETWSPVSDTAETWTPESDTSETWTQIADNSTSWQQAT